MKKKTVQHPKSSAGTHPKIENVNIKSVVVLATPDALHQELPLTPKAVRTVSAARRTIAAILDGKDPRQLAIVGPCSLHNLAAAEDYAARLHRLAKELDETLCIVMRVYFEKPRSILGWKGLINDPYLDDTFKMEDGLRMARAFLLRLAERGLAAATEVLDTLTPQYLGDLFAWSAIGARTAESQTHREIASGISTPVGFKNATDGSLEAAINGIKTAAGEHHFLGVTAEGLPAIFATAGNPIRISCFAAAPGPTTIRPASPSARTRWRRRVFPPRSWSIAATRIPARSPSARGSSFATSCRRSKTGTARFAASCWRASSSGEASSSPKTRASFAPGCRSPIPALTGTPPRSSCARPPPASPRGPVDSRPFAVLADPAMRARSDPDAS